MSEENLVKYWDGWELTGTEFAGKLERGKWVQITAEERQRREDNLDKWIAKVRKIEAKLKRIHAKGPKR